MSDFFIYVGALFLTLFTVWIVMDFSLKVYLKLCSKFGWNSHISDFVRWEKRFDELEKKLFPAGGDVE